MRLRRSTWLRLGDPSTTSSFSLSPCQICVSLNVISTLLAADAYCDTIVYLFFLRARDIFCETGKCINFQ